MISCIGGFLFGYDTSVIAGAQLYFEDDLPGITDFTISLIVSVTLAGAAIGSLMGGISDRIGRKPTIIISDIIFIFGAIIMSLAPTVTILIVGRFIIGIGLGIAAIIIPVYLSEICPSSKRGMIVSANVSCLVLAQLFSTILCIMLAPKWRWMLGLAGVPALIQCIGMIFMPETPSFLFKKNKLDEAEKVLLKIYKENKSFKRVVQEYRSEA